MDFNHSMYTLEFFNFTPEQISAERESVVKSLIKRAVESTIKKIETPATSALLNEKKDNVIRLMQESVEKKLDQFRELDKATFSVPPHVLLIKDFDLEKQVSVEEVEAKEAELEELKLRYRENMAMLAELEAEEKKYTALEPLIENELEMHNRIYEVCANFNYRNTYKFAQHLLEDLQIEEKM